VNRRQRRALKRTPLDLQAALDALGPCPDYGADVATIEQAAAVARARVAWQAKRAATIEQYRRRSRISDVEVLQAMHSPTVELSVDDPAGKRRTRANLTRVRKSEAWRHNRLTAMQRQAESEIEAVWSIRTAGTGMAISNLQAIHGGGVGSQPRNDELELAWVDFLREAKAKRLHLRLLLAVITQPVTLADVERDMRLVPGEAFPAFVAGLDLWCAVRGWTIERPV
jgi:hypothetical protein